MEWFGISDTKLFHFHMIFKNGGGGGGGGREGIKRAPPLWIRHGVSYITLINFS